MSQKLINFSKFFHLFFAKNKIHLKLHVGLILSLCILQQAAFSQIAGWNPGTPTALSNYGSSPWTPTTTVSGITYGGLTRGSGIGTSGTAVTSAWGGSMTNANLSTTSSALTAGQVITFSLRANPATSVDLSFSTFDLSYRRTSTGPSLGLLQFSLDGTNYTDISSLSFSSTSTSGAAISQVNLSTISSLQNVSSANTVRMRIILYNNTTAGGQWYVYGSGLTIGGTVNLLPPSAPTINSITSGNNQLSVAFTAGTGTSISNYSYSLDSGVSWVDRSPASTSTPILITGLTNGTKYKVRIRAINPAGSGTASAFVGATPYTVPSAPIINQIVAGNQEVSVYFTSPSDNGGQPLKNYSYSLDNGSTWTDRFTTSTSNPIIIKGLTNGTNYTIKIRTLNVGGFSIASNAMNATPFTGLGAPTINSVALNGSNLSVNFSPGTNSGASITNYAYSLNNGSTWSNLSPVATASPLTITGITPGSNYNVAIRPINANGYGLSSISKQIASKSVPPAPLINSATVTNNSATIQIGNPAILNSAINYTDSVLDLFDNISYPNLDIMETLVSTDNTNLIFKIKINANINTTNWGKYVIGISTGKNPGSANSNGWSRPITLFSPQGGMDYWIGVGIDASPFWEQRIFLNNAWTLLNASYNVPSSNAVAITKVVGATSELTISVSKASLGVMDGDLIYFDIYSTGGGNDPAIDALAGRNSVLGWASSYSTEPTSVGGNGTCSYVVGGFPAYEAINGYEYSIDNGLTYSMISSAGPLSSLTITGLNPATSYPIKIRAINSIGAGLSSDTYMITTTAPPSAPVITSVTTGVGRAFINFNPPASDGGSSITNYEYSIDNGTSWATRNPASTLSPIEINGLSNCTTYDVLIRAVNSYDSGTPTVAVSVTPRSGQTAGINWISRTSAADLAWESVTYGNGTFVAVAASSSGNTVMTSPDGITWTSRTPASNNYWHSITFGNGLFVAVSSTGTGNRVMTSNDGITWTSRNAAADITWESVTFGNGLFVAVSSSLMNTQVMTSLDGFTWTIRNSAMINQWKSVTYGNGLFVAVGWQYSSNQVMTSMDGITWTARTSPARDWESVTFGNGLFVAVSGGGINRVMTSSDGTIWTLRTSAANNSWNSVTYGNGLFVAVADGGLNYGPDNRAIKLMTSPDGIVWTARISAADNSWVDINYGNGMFVALSNSGTGNRIMTSFDQLVPDKPVINLITPAADYVTANFSAPSDAGSSTVDFYEYSIDNGSNWVAPIPPVLNSPMIISGLTPNANYPIQIRAVNVQGSGCASIAVNTNTLALSVPGVPVITSATGGENNASIEFIPPSSDGGGLITNYEYSTDNGTTWITRSPASTSSPIEIAGLSNCTNYNVKIRAVNSAGSGLASSAANVIPRSTQLGMNWTSGTPALVTAWNAVTYGNGLFVAVSFSGTGNRVMTSTDGINWIGRTQASNNQWWSVTYGNGLFVAVASTGTGNRVMTSTDGITWTARISAADNQWRSVTYGNGLFVAVASSGTGNRVMTSQDGINWSIRNSAADNEWYSVTYGNGLFVAVASTGTGNRVMTSPDGFTWTIRTSAADNNWTSVTYGNGIYVAVSNTGSGNRVMTSSDGFTWTIRTSASNNNWSCISYGNGLFVALQTVVVGTNNLIMTSTDGIIWALQTSFTNYNSWRSIIYGDRKFVAIASNAVMISSELLTPAKPLINQIIPSLDNLQVNYTVPTDTGTSLISNYEYSIDNGSTWVTRNPASTVSPLIISGLTSATTYQIKLRAINSQGSGCPSTMMNATTSSLCTPTASTTHILKCTNQLPYSWNGNNYNLAGSYNITLTNAAGCDSVATLELAVKATTSSNTAVTICTNQLPYFWNGNSFSTAGTYSVILNNSVGCDSIATLSLSSIQSSSNTTTIFSCDIYSWPVNGQTYTSSGSYTAINGCATEILNLTITPSSNNTISASACDSYTWSINGQTYTSSGSYTSVSGCTTHFLNLNISPRPTIPTLACYETASFNSSSCSWVVTGSQPSMPTLACYETATFNTTTCTWLLSGTQPPMPTLACYQTANFNTSTCSWDVTGTAPSVIVTTTSACNTYTWSVNSNAYTQSGTYNYNTNCQDYTLNLTIKQPTTSTTTATASGSYTWNGNTYNNSGTYTYHTTNEAGCDSTATLSLTINAIVINNITNVCNYIGTNQTLSYTASVSGASSYVWILPPNTQLVSGQGTRSIVIKLLNGFASQANKQIRVTPLGRSMQIIYLAAQAPVTPATITASTANICGSIGTNVPIIFKIPKVYESGTTNLTATSYLWSAQNGTTNITHPNGTGINDTTIVVTFNNNFSTSSITVQSVNACGVSAIRSYLITRNNPTVGIISGPVNSCEYLGTSGAIATYSVSANMNINSYTWTLPLGASDVVGQNTNIVSFRYPSGYTGGSISITGTNGCGTSTARSLLISRLLPGIPSNIDVINTQVCPNREFTYSLASMPGNATSLLWTVPSLGTMVSGQGTRSITVSYPTGVVDGVVTVKAVSNCGVSNIRTLIIKLAPCPSGLVATNTKRFKKNVRSSMDLKVFPNPTISSFSLQVYDNVSSSVINVRVLDVQGRLMKNISINPNETILLGSDFKPGVYMLEVKQGEEKKVVRVVKY